MGLASHGRNANSLFNFRMERSNTMENVKELSPRQVEIREGVKSFTNAQKGFVSLVASVLVGYWLNDSQNPVNVQFLIQELHDAGHPRYTRAVLQLVALYLPVDVTFKKADKAYTVVNRKGVNKKRKQVLCDTIGAYDWDGLNAILNHDALNGGSKKGKGKKEPEKEVTFRDVVLAELEKGTTMEQMIDLLAEICAEVAAENTGS
jgi:hypothetical protein